MSKPVQDRTLRQAGARIDGVDVAQLPRDIGEASVSSSAVDLFGMCLAAQRVLQLVQVGQAAVITRDETAMLLHFRVMEHDVRRDALCVMKSLADMRSRTRPALSIVHSSSLQDHGTVGHKKGHAE